MQIRVILLAIFILFSSDSIANDTHWKIGLNFSPDYAYRSLYANKPDVSTQHSLDIRNNREIVKLSYNAGLVLRKNIGRIFFFETGLNIADKGYRFRPEVVYSGNPNDSSSVLTPIGSTFTVNHFLFWAIPIKLGFTAPISNNKLLSLTLGLIPEKALTFYNKQSTEFYNGTSEKSRPTLDMRYHRTINVSTYAGIGIYFKLSERFDLHIDPYFRKQIINFNKQLIEEKLWSSGLNISLFLSL